MRKYGLVLFIILIIVVWTSTTPPSIFAEEQTAWTIAKVSEAKTTSELYSFSPNYYFYPASSDDIFLLVGFQLKAEKGAPPLDVQDIIIVMDGRYEFHPVGCGSISPMNMDRGSGIVSESAGGFTGTFNPDGIFYWSVHIPEKGLRRPGAIINNKMYSPLLGSSFVYVVPKKYINGTHCFQLKIVGSGGVYFTVEPPLPPQGYVSMSSEGNYIVVTREKNLYLFERTSSSPLWNYTANNWLRPAKISSDGTYILVLGPHALLLFHKSSPEPLWTMDFEVCHSAIISADGSHVAVAAIKEGEWGYYVYLIDAPTGNLVSKMLETAIFFIENLTVSSNGNYIAVEGNKAIYLFDGFKSSEVWSYEGRLFDAVSISPDGNYIGAVYDASNPSSKPGEKWSYTQTVLMFQRSSSTPIWDYTSSISPFDSYHSCVFSADGNYLVAWGGYKLTLFSRDSNTPMWSKDDFYGHIDSVAVSSDGSFVAVGCRGKYDTNTIYLLDRAGNTLWSRTDIGNQVAISQDGGSIAVSSRTFVHLLKRDGSSETIFPFEPEEIQEFKLTLQEGINFISVPLDPSGAPDGKPWRLSDLIDFIGSGATMIIRYDQDAKKFVTYMPDFPKTSPANAAVKGDEGYIVLMSEPANVTFTGTAWDGKVSLAAGINVISLPLINPCVERLSDFDVTGTVGDDGRYVVTLADLEGNRAAQVGNLIEVVALEPTGAFDGEPIRYTIKANDIQAGKVSLGNLPMSPIPKRSALLQNYPNPFNPETWIPYQLAEESDVSITIYDVSGRLVRILQLGQKKAGFYITKSKSAYWDGRDELGQKVASGVYFYTLQTHDFATTRKMVIVK